MLLNKALLDKAEEAVVEFMQCDEGDPRYVGEHRNTKYADGGEDIDLYFEVESQDREWHVVASYRHVDHSFSVYFSDGVVW